MLGFLSPIGDACASVGLTVRSAWKRLTGQGPILPAGEPTAEAGRYVGVGVAPEGNGFDGERNRTQLVQVLNPDAVKTMSVSYCQSEEVRKAALASQSSGKQRTCETYVDKGVASVVGTLSAAVFLVYLVANQEGETSPIPVNIQVIVGLICGLVNLVLTYQCVMNEIYASLKRSFDAIKTRGMELIGENKLASFFWTALVLAAVCMGLFISMTYCNGSEKSLWAKTLNSARLLDPIITLHILANTLLLIFGVIDVAKEISASTCMVRLGSFWLPNEARLSRVAQWGTMKRLSHEIRYAKRAESVERFLRLVGIMSGKVSTTGNLTLIGKRLEEEHGKPWEGIDASPWAALSIPQKVGRVIAYVIQGLVPFSSLCILLSGVEGSAEGAECSKSRLPALKLPAQGLIAMNLENFLPALGMTVANGCFGQSFASKVVEVSSSLWESVGNDIHSSKKANLAAFFVAQAIVLPTAVTTLALMLASLDGFPAALSPFAVPIAIGAVLSAWWTNIAGTAPALQSMLRALFLKIFCPGINADMPASAPQYSARTYDESRMQLLDDAAKAAVQALPSPEIFNAWPKPKQVEVLSEIADKLYQLLFDAMLAYDKVKFASEGEEQSVVMTKGRAALQQKCSDEATLLFKAFNAVRDQATVTVQRLEVA